MLILLMLALSDPATMTPSTSMIERGAPRVVTSINLEAPVCADPLIQAEQANGDRATPLLDRSLADGQVRRYLLLDRRDQNNCPLPISYAVPDQRALGRNLAAPQPDAALRQAPLAPRR